MHSKPVNLLMQASSAVLLSKRQPKMRLKALSLQSEAFSAVRAEIGNLQGLVVSDELMLSSIIAGLTSAWYDVNDIGLSHVLGSQVLLSIWLKSQNYRLKYQQTFILGAYIYWFMIAAFVSGDPWSSFMYQEALQQAVRDLEMSHDPDDTNVPGELRKVFPHPLTGFSMQLYILIGKVGSLCRLQHSVVAPSDGIRGFIDEKVQSVESELLNIVLSRQSNFRDPQDPHTTVDEILKVGEAFRFAGLLQLYTAFPRLLEIQAQHSAMDDGWAHKGMYTSTQMEADGPSPIEGVMSMQKNWLRALAFHILQILEPVPATSGTRGYLGLPVLIAGSWLIDPVDMNCSDPDNKGNQFAIEHPRLPLLEGIPEKEYWREIVREGLRRHNDYVGLQQVSRILEILEEVWHLDDSGTTKCDCKQLWIFIHMLPNPLRLILHLVYSVLLNCCPQRKQYSRNLLD